MIKNVHFISDPGHGWLKISRKEVDRLGIADKISPCSYISNSGKTVYLEEDCDAELAIEAYRALGHTITVSEQVGNGVSRIRNLLPFKAYRELFNY